MRRFVIGLMGSSAGTLPAEQQQRLMQLAGDLGKEIARHALVLMTGETSGLPNMVATAAREHGGLTIGIAPAHSPAEQAERYPHPEEPSDVVIYTGLGLKGRNVISVRSADIVLIVAGSIGTLNEFTIAYDEGKIIGVLTGSGGVSDHLENIVDICRKKTAAKLIYDDDPKSLLARCISELSARA